MDPADIKKHLSEASEWLSKRKRWRMSEITWSASRDSKKLDRAGKANSTKFWFITHTQMTDTIQFEMENNNFIRAARNLWSRQGCIPKGGSFSAQAADLHSLWSVYNSHHLFYTLGQLSVSPEGFPYWSNPHGTVALCQFRDNILIATTFPIEAMTVTVQPTSNPVPRTTNGV